jgi:hypothetical protein
MVGYTIRMGLVEKLAATTYIRYTFRKVSADFNIGRNKKTL